VTNPELHIDYFITLSSGLVGSSARQFARVFLPRTVPVLARSKRREVTIQILRSEVVYRGEQRPECAHPPPSMSLPLGDIDVVALCAGITAPTA
jgi:hypothetical protein